MDCISFADIYAWHDLDEDGQQETDEPPLPGATIVITGIGTKTVTTDATGEAHHSVLYGCPAHHSVLYGCPWRDFVAIATPPPGYRLTTPDRLAVPFRTSATPQFVRFGFAKEAP
jgi:hypothetical protein